METDVREARAIKEVFGSDSNCPPTFAASSYMGSLGAGSGTAELAASVLAMEHALLPPTLNYEEPDPDCPIPVSAKEPRPVKGKYALKTSFTEMGQCAALVIRKP